MSALSVAIQQLRSTVNIEKETLSQSDAAECIESIRHILIDLLNRFNACSSVSRLPEAVLTMIFEFAAFRDTIDTLEAHRTRGDVYWKTLILLTHVCSEWRRVALDYPALWTRLGVHYYGDYRFPTIVKRTKSMPLDINLWVDILQSYPDFTSEFRGSSKRSTLSFTSLECLKIFYTDEATSHKIVLKGRSPEVLISGKEVSHIKALALHARDILPFIPADRFPDLTHVHIRLEYVDVSDLISLLAQAIRIESLGLEGVKSVVRALRVDEFSPFIVSSMKTVHFDDSSLPSACKILSYISLPSFVLVRFNRGDRSTSMQGEGAESLSSLLNDAKLSIHNTTHVEFDASPYRLFLAASPSRKIRIHERTSGVQWGISMLLSLHSVISFSNVSSLVLGTKYGDWHNSITLFEAFPCLVDLSLHVFNSQSCESSDQAESLIRILASSPTPCPDLRSLTIACYMGEAQNAETADLATDLISLVKVRHAAGVPLRRLIVQPHQHRYYFLADPKTLACLETRRKLYAPLEDLVEEFKYVECGVTIIELGKRMAHRFHLDGKYWDITQRSEYRMFAT